MQTGSKRNQKRPETVPNPSVLLWAESTLCVSVLQGGNLLELHQVQPAIRGGLHQDPEMEATLLIANQHKELIVITYIVIRVINF
jgi:hypothetical protein